ncbi:hypothetical protein [Paenibacillus sp. S150]|uniref:hypothetical protein n=1 Tax=Paenibacillus sp. S150 TaxID=2749826 RepID=UPI001C57652A|nr:hypothetical protein [Paenibacillus sp. S150]MBW4081984.1 hypothetical protein [Paenibacillus sp. S150]
MKPALKDSFRQLKTKPAAAAVFAVLLLTLGTSAAFAATGIQIPAVNAESQGASADEQLEAVPVSAAGSSIAAETREDGKTYYSADEGKTWSLEVPAGFQIIADDEKGSIQVVPDGISAQAASYGAPVEEAGTFTVEVREDGKQYFSADGGESWSLTPPAGIQLSRDGDSYSASISNP